MTWLVWKIRTWFCTHELEYAEIEGRRRDGGNYFANVKVSTTCKKCGWHRSYWKYL